MDKSRRIQSGQKPADVRPKEDAKKADESKFAGKGVSQVGDTPKKRFGGESAEPKDESEGE